MFTKELIRSYLIKHSCLDRRREMGAGDLCRRLQAIQMDPVNLVGRNHELVFFSRLAGRRADLADYYGGTSGLFEYIAGNRCLLPIEDLPIFVPFMRRRERTLAEDLARLAGPIRLVLDELERRGPLCSRQIDCRELTHGYWDGERPRTKETTLALHYLWECGRITVAGRQGAASLYDLSERVFPSALTKEGDELDPATARQRLRWKYYRAYLVFDLRDPIFGWQRLTAAERAAALQADAAAGLVEPLPIEDCGREYWGVAGIGQALKATAEAGDEAGEARFLPPLDNLLWRRDRLAEIFSFTYRWEIYTPAVKRRSGPYTMPVLYGHNLIGRLDASADRAGSSLRIERLLLEPGVRKTKELSRAIEAELENLRGFCGLGRIRHEGVRESKSQKL